MLKASIRSKAFQCSSSPIRARPRATASQSWRGGCGGGRSASTGRHRVAAAPRRRRCTRRRRLRAPRGATRASGCSRAPPAQPPTRRAARWARRSSSRETRARPAPEWSDAAKPSTWAAFGWKATASGRSLRRWAPPHECGGQPQAFRCSLMRPAMASPRRRRGHFEHAAARGRAQR